MIRLVLIIILFMASLLALFRAPAYYLWLLAIAVTEFPVIFAGITALVTAYGFFSQRYQLSGTVLGLITFMIFLSPVVRAYAISRNVRTELHHDFRIKYIDSQKDEPFNLIKLFKFGSADIESTTYIYTSYPGISLTLDYYASQLPGLRPCVVVVHGGSWSSGDSRQLPELNSYLAKTGYNVAAINYRLAPAYKNPAPVQDVKAAINYLCKNAGKLHIDTGNLVLLGRSAGAQVALLAAYTLHSPGLKGVIDFYGPADMVWGYSVPANPLVMDSRGVMERYLGGPYNAAPEKYAASSPIAYVNRGTVPTLIIHGANDVLVAYGHSSRLEEKLRQNGVPHYWLKLPWATHGFDYNLNGPGGQLSTYAVKTFLEAVTK